MGDNMFAVVNTYTRAAQFKGLSAENSYQRKVISRTERYGMLESITPGSQKLKLLKKNLTMVDRLLK
jgi:hypothetical protein